MDNIQDFLFVKDNFLQNYDQVLKDSDGMEYTPDQNGLYPGIRTKDLTGQYGKDIVESAISLINKENKKFDYHFHFHINTTYSNEACNEGWIHSDGSHYTGLIYLTPRTIDVEAGTSFYNQKTRFLNESPLMREFFKGKCNEESYVNALKENNFQYELINNVPFVTNRLVIFDSRTPHKVNNYKLRNNQPRKSILFYINFI